MSYIGNSPGVASQRVATSFTATSGQTVFTPSAGYTLGYLDVYQNGVKLIVADDYTAADGVTFTLTTGAAVGDAVECVAYFPRGLSDGYLKAEADAKYVVINSTAILGAGTVTTPSISTTGDTNTGIYFPAADTIAFTEGGTEVMRINSSGNVGISTTTMVAKLNVLSAGENVALFQSSAAPALIRFRDSGTTYDPYIASYGNAMAFGRYGSSETMRIDSSGNTFIGVSSAVWDERLGIRPVTGAGQVGIGVYTASTTYASSLIRVQTETSGTGLKLYEGRGAGGSVLYYVDGTGVGYFAGNVGIGTTSPAAKLEVSSATGSATPTPTEIRISTTTNAADWSTTLPWGRLGYYSADVSAFGPKLLASIDVIANASSGGAASIIFNTVESSAGTLTERMRITNLGDVGIGTTPTTQFQVYNATSSILQVDGDATTNIRVNRYSTDTNNAAISIRKARGTFASPTAVASSDTVASVQGSAYGGTTYRNVGLMAVYVDTYTSDTNISGYLSFQTNSGSTGTTERMRINANGAVGIGNSSPGAQNLHVGSGAGGSTAINGYTRLAVEGSDYAVVTVKCPAANFSQIIFADSATTNLGGINYFGSTNATPNAMAFLTGGGNERMRIDSSGNVGVGTTSPSTYVNGYNKSIVVGDGTNWATIQGRTDGPSGAANGVSYGGSYSTNPINGARMFIGATSAGQRGIITFSTKDLDDNTTQPLERMRIDSSGNVGIGAIPSTSGTSPKALEFTYGALSSYGGSEFDLSGNVYIATNAWIYKTTAAANLLQLSGGAFSFQTAASGTAGTSCGFTERVRIDNVGRVISPYQPAFSAQRSTTVTAPAVIAYDTVLLNAGSNYSTSTGRFTAPIAGNYFFYCTFTCDRTTTTGDYYCDIRKNGTAFVRVYTNGHSDANAHPTAAAEIVLPMAANDYVDVYFANGATGIHANSIHNVFGGHMIG